MIKKYYFIFIILYTLLLLYWMFFGFGRTPNSEKYIQIIPFTTLYKIFTQTNNIQHFIINIFGNILLFIPFGFLGILAEKLKKAKFLFPAFILCISCVEGLQHITRRGFAEIDDVLLNTLGVAIGFWFFRYFTKKQFIK